MWCQLCWTVGGQSRHGKSNPVASYKGIYHEKINKFEQTCGDMYVYRQILQQDAEINWLLLRTTQKRITVKDAKVAENLKRTWD